MDALGVPGLQLLVVQLVRCDSWNDEPSAIGTSERSVEHDTPLKNFQERSDLPAEKMQLSRELHFECNVCEKSFQQKADFEGQVHT